MPEELKTPKDRQLTAPVKVEPLLQVHHQRQFLQILTPWGWIVQRDDGKPFETLAAAIASVKPAAPTEQEATPEAS